MITAIDANDFNSNYIIIQETKNNNIIDGSFTKFFYSTNYMVMMGLYIKLPIEPKQTFMAHDKKNVQFIRSQKNTELCDKVCEIERDILNIFKKYINDKKIQSFHIKDQLNSNVIKITNEWTDANVALYSKPRRKHNFTYTSIPFKNKQSSFTEKDKFLKANEPRNNKTYYAGKYDAKPNTIPYNKSAKTIYIIKISGIWETSLSYGLTYKIIECTAT
jgi:hypothetical protein